MPSLSDNYKSSLYCWLILCVFILLTVGFMLNFYQHTVDEISRRASQNYQLNFEKTDM